MFPFCFQIYEYKNREYVEENRKRGKTFVEKRIFRGVINDKRMRAHKYYTVYGDVTFSIST